MGHYKTGTKEIIKNNTDITISNEINVLLVITERYFDVGPLELQKAVDNLKF